MAGGPPAPAIATGPGIPAALRAALSERRLVVASHNAGKVREIRDLLVPFGLSVVSAGELGLPEPEETADTFVGNAQLKAVAAALASGLPSLADDSGLAVEALDGAPGIYSARWAGPERDFDAAMARVDDALRKAGAKTPAARRARFVCVLSLAATDGTTVDFAGEVAGSIVWPPQGDQGFGYDPIFLPDGHDRTFGEMDAEEKHGWRPGLPTALSHRARAFKALAETLFPHHFAQGTPGAGNSG